jgi:N-acetylmuramoyl-L-alanine amidase
LNAQSYKTNVRRLLSIALILLFVADCPDSKGHRQDYRIRTIVIDAGHGGHDSGCLGASAKEKVVALSVALKLGKMIEETYPDIKVIYTRKTDVFIPLHERADIANRHKADLFICIHCNSGNKAAFGVETYVMGLHKTEDNLAVAKRENASILLEEDYKQQYEGFDPNSPEANIIFNLYQNQFLNQSLMFASNVQEEAVEYAGRHNRGVKQAGFLVLYKTAMPSVLIETGFLTHDAEEKFLLSEKGQSNIASSIFRAFRKYKVDTESPGADNSATIADTASHASAPDATDEKTQGISAKVQSEKQETVSSGPSDNSTVKNKTENTVKEKSAPLKEYIEPPAKEKPASAVIKNEVYFTVQVGASQKPEKDAERYRNIPEFNAVKGEDGFTRFNSGNFSNITAAKKRQSDLKSAGYADCFITGYKGSKKISVAEASSLLQNK